MNFALLGKQPRSGEGVEEGKNSATQNIYLDFFFFSKGSRMQISDDEALNGCASSSKMHAGGAQKPPQSPSPPGLGTEAFFMNLS